MPNTPGLPPGERVIARTALRVGALLAVPAAVLAGLTAGPGAAGLALALVVLLAGGLAAVAWAVGRAAPHGPAAVVAAALGGSVAKLGLVVALLASTPREVIDAEVVAAITLTALVLLLAAASWAVLRQPTVWWIEPGSADREHLSTREDGRTHA